MITYVHSIKCFLLSGKNYSYAMFVNKAGFLQHLYFGGKIKEGDLTYLVKAHGEGAAPNPEDLNMDMATDGMPSELGSFGRGDFRSASVIVKRGDGAKMSRFKYL